MTIRGALGSALIIVISVTVSILAMEYGTRLIYPQLIPSGQLRLMPATKDLPVLGPRSSRARQIKNTGDYDVMVSFNKYGLRDAKDISTGTKQGIYIVGDSLIFGWGVEADDRISEKLEKITGLRVFNLAMPTNLDGYGKLLRYAGKNGADVKNVIIAISMETSIEDYDAAPVAVPANRNGTDIIRPIKYYLMSNSAFYFFVTSFIHKNESLRMAAIRMGLIIPNLEGVAYKAYSRQAILSTARRTAELASRYNSTIFIAPSRALWNGTPDDRDTAKRIHDEFVTELKKRNIDPIDLRVEFEANGPPSSYFFKYDGHWNPKGHNMAAQTLATHLHEKSKVNVPKK